MPNCGLLQYAQPGRSLARIDHARQCSGHGRDVLRRHRGYAGEALQEIKRQPLPGQDAARVASHACNRGHGGRHIAIRNQWNKLQRGIDLGEDLLRGVQPGNDTGRLRQQRGLRLCVRRDSGGGRNITAQQILGQGQLNQGRPGSPFQVRRITSHALASRVRGLSNDSRRHVVHSLHQCSPYPGSPGRRGAYQPNR